MIKIILIPFLAMMLMSCDEQESPEAGAATLPSSETSGGVTEKVGQIEVLSDSNFEAESSNEILSVDEMNIEPSSLALTSDVPVKDFPISDTPSSDDNSNNAQPEGDNSNDEPAGEDPVSDAPHNDAPSDEEMEDEAEADEEADVKCRRRGNLIVNGSFELSDDRIGLKGKKLSGIIEKGWDVYQGLPSKVEGKDSWYTSNGPGIEIQGDNTLTKAAHGKRVVELDSHGAEDTNSTMSQDVLLCRGKHILKFMYYPRTQTESDNGIEVKIGDKVIKSVDMVKDGNWYRVRAPFRVKEAKEYKISFSAVGKDNSLGGLIDKISLHKRKRRAGVVTSLISLGDQDNIESPLIRREIASAIIRKAVNFASIKKKPKILFVKDSRHGGESLDDFVLSESILREVYGDANVSVWSQDLRMQNAEGFDVIYVINPGYPMGSSVSANTLKTLKEKGNVGIVIHGDDMARGRNFNMKELTGLEYKSNGTNACGIKIDNNRGNKYSIKLRKRFFKKLSVQARTLEYANDIDHTEVINENIRILAMAKAPVGCDLKIPAIVGYKLKRPVKEKVD